MAYDISSWNKPAGPATNRELDRRAMRLLPDWAKAVVREVADPPRRSDPRDLRQGQGAAHCGRQARGDLPSEVRKTVGVLGQLGLWFNRDHSTILFALVRFQELNGAPVLSMRRPQRSAA